MSDSCDPMDCSLPGSSAHRIFRINIPNLPADSVAGLLAPLPGSSREQPGACPHLTLSTPKQDDSKNKEGIDIVPAAAAAKSHQSCPTLCNPIDGSPPGSPIPTSCKIPDRIKHKLESRLPGEISITSDTQLKPGVLQSTGSQRVRHN